MSLLIAFVTAHLAHAIVNLDGCDRLLNVARNVDVALTPDQIALRGRLSFDTSVFGSTVPYVVYDDHLREEITGPSWSTQFPLQPGDRIFLVDGNGGVEVEGVYGEVLVDETKSRGPGELQAFHNQPTLLRSAKGRAALDRRAFARAFDADSGRLAVVIQSIEAGYRERLQTDLQPWFDLHARQPTQYVTFDGRRFAMRSFEQADSGQLVVSKHTYAKALGGGTTVDVKLRPAKGRIIPIYEGSSLALFDEDKNLFAFLRVKRKMNDEEKVLRSAHHALLIHPMTEVPKR